MSEKCFGCGLEVEEDDILWVEPLTGAATCTYGEPFHPKCAPQEAIPGLDFERDIARKVLEAQGKK